MFTGTNVGYLVHQRHQRSAVNLATKVGIAGHHKFDNSALRVSDCVSFHGGFLASVELFLPTRWRSGSALILTGRKP